MAIQPELRELRGQNEAKTWQVVCKGVWPEEDLLPEALQS